MAFTTVIKPEGGVSFQALIAGAPPAVLEQVILTGGPFVPGYLNLVGQVINSANPNPVGSFVLYDSNDTTQKLYGVTYDQWIDAKALLLGQAPFTFTGNTATTTGNDGEVRGITFVGTTASSTTISSLSINSNLIPLGTVITGPGILPNTTVTARPTTSSITISQATTTSVSNNTITGVTSGIVVGNLPANNTIAPNQATSVITGVSTTALQVGSFISGAGIPQNSVILNILSPSAILISNNVTATATGVTLTSSAAYAQDLFINVATTQNPTTRFNYNYFVGANGETVDIDALIDGGIASKSPMWNGLNATYFVTFDFIGA